MRKTIVAGNWKMNKTPSETVALVNELKPLVATETSDVVFCVPAICIPAAIEAAKGSNINICLLYTSARLQALQPISWIV